MHPVNWLRVILGFLLVPLFLVGQTSGEQAAEERLLKDNRVAPDGPSVLAFLRLRSPTPDDRKVVAQLLDALGSDSFEEREAASRNLIPRGTSILADLKKRAEDPDAEVRRRVVQAIDEIEQGPGSALSVAAIRQLVRTAPVDSVPALLRFVPFVEDEMVEDEVVLALEQLSKGRPLDRMLLESLRAAPASVRGVAGRVVGRLGDTSERALAVALLKDASGAVRFRVAQGLIGAGQRDAVAVIIALLTEESPLCWQAEEVLFRLAGDRGPSETTSLLGIEGRQKSRQTWETWWRDHANEVDLTRLSNTRQLGLTLGIEYNTGRVWEAGPDFALRFEIKGLQGPMEAQLLPGGRILIAESNARQVTERDLKGNVLWTHDLQGREPTGCQRLANGNTFISTYSQVMEINREGKSVYNFTLPQGSNAIRKHRNGNVIFTIDDHIVEVDTTGREVRRVPIPRESMWVGLRDLPGDRFLIANSSSGRVLEIDRTGKILWEARVPGACGIERTAVGHTLVATANRVVELDRAAKIVWEMKSPGYVRRVHRR